MFVNRGHSQGSGTDFPLALLNFPKGTLFNRAGHSEETPGKAKGEATKQRASEQPVFMYLSSARACMKIWCIFERDIAIKWRELLVVE